VKLAAVLFVDGFMVGHWGGGGRRKERDKEMVLV